MKLLHVLRGRAAIRGVSSSYLTGASQEASWWQQNLQMFIRLEVSLEGDHTLDRLERRAILYENESSPVV
jgi:hypothetical protein